MDVEWDIHRPLIAFEPPSKDEVENTGAVHQADLVQLRWNCEASSAATKTLLIHNGDTEQHHSSVESDHPEKPERTVRMTEKELRVFEDGLNSIFLCNSSFEIAGRAVGSALEGAARFVASVRFYDLGLAVCVAVVPEKL
ncbi:unnamed protein product [Nippostrongylus brasiliensis]|uniref:Uncharacterized protein n=1 Tax=Nippostrongylus brasiliensis TaxID=27835 RepID=A0A0N4YYI4_NIPBR|nr:unnamed protein product [Nippostrongylus brasiliensis]